MRPEITILPTCALGWPCSTSRTIRNGLVCVGFGALAHATVAVDAIELIVLATLDDAAKGRLVLVMQRDVEGAENQ
jgi:hypothetical protein